MLQSESRSALVLLACALAPGGQAAPGDLAAEYTHRVRPLMTRFCLDCHSTKDKKGELDLERYTSIDDVRKDVRPWQHVLEMVENGEMPPAKKPQPSTEERRRLTQWVRGLLDSEARAHAGDPGRVVLRRLSNAEYNYTVRDLTGVDLQPAQEFPADGAAGEGFANTGEALTMSPALLDKYLGAAKEIADRAVLLPDGFRFSASKTRRDWTDEARDELRRFYAQFSDKEGTLPLRSYLAATIRHRDEPAADLEAAAARDKLNPRYFRILWQTLNDPQPSFPLDRLRARWRKSTLKDVDALVTEISAWQAPLWRYVPIGSYRYGNLIRQLPNDPAIVETQTVKLQVKPVPGQNEVVVYLAARVFSTPERIVWGRPRLEGANKPPLLLRDYAQFGPSFEVDYPALFADTAGYLAATAGATKQGLDPILLKRWIDLLAPGAAVPLELLDRKLSQKPAINGWRSKSGDLPSLVTNASDNTENIPGRVSPHKVAVHPTPTHFVAAAWKSPIEGRVRVSARIDHAHPACGNGVAWRLEQRHGNQATLLAEGALDLGKNSDVPPTERDVAVGDLVLLAVHPRDANHQCDLTEINLTLTAPGRVWDLAGDVADSVLDGNPHADKLGNPDVWRFVQGPTQASAVIPPNSVLAKWRDAASDPKRQKELAEQVQSLLTGRRPAQEKNPDRVLYDTLLSLDGPLLRDIDWKARPATNRERYGLDPTRFSDADIVVPANEVVEVRLPAALFRGREFVVEGRIDKGVVQFQVLTSPPNPDSPLDGKSPCVGTAAKQLFDGLQEFRRCFPPFICFAQVIPLDEVVSLKLFHREDEPLMRLFLDDASVKRLDRLWEELRFISRYPLEEHRQLPQFIGYVTQDQPKELLAYFESQREPFRLRAEQFERDVEAAIPGQLVALTDFAARAWRRPDEKNDIPQLYAALRKKGLPHDEAFRAVLARILISPAFLYRLERAPDGKEARPVSDSELAVRLSYFLWSAPPDAELLRAAAEGRLGDPAEQARRMLKDERVRGLAIEFGAQWLHVRGFDERREKNEKLFPMFDEKLRRAIYEETILFFKDLFQGDRPVARILDADYTFLNETLARHYAIPGVAGPEWRRVDGVGKHGRGGILALGSVLATQSGASRTSPVLRGNWVVETLLGEKLPRPPANVPRLPEEETGNDGLSVRMLVEKHARAPECAVCHVRIDPFGFALEKYDPIGRRREKDLGGNPVETRARLKDGTEFDDLDGLRRYLLNSRKDVFLRNLCRKLLGYALGRAVILSDQPLLDEMVAELKKDDGRVSAAVMVIVRSRQFRYIRGLAKED